MAFDLTAALTPAEGRPIETITTEILHLKQQAGTAILEIGHRLIEAKKVLPHGEWLPWLENQVEFSERAAQNLMKLSREWTNPQALADLGATKALTLLALPADEREIFLTETHVVNGEEKTVSDMTTRQLEQAIKERDESKDALEKVQAQTAEAVKAREQTEQELSRVRAELEELRAKPVEVAVMQVDQEAIDKAKAEALEELKAVTEKATKDRTAAKDRLKKMQAELETAQTELEAMKKSRAEALTSNDKEVAEFNVYFIQSQEMANKMRGVLLKFTARDDKTTAAKLSKAMTQLAEAIKGAAR